MQQPKIDKYFSEKNIKVHYNTLGHTPELVNAYVSTFQNIVDLSLYKRSQDVKHTCYNKLYDVVDRPKLTGFEDVVSEDKKFREKIVGYLTDVFYGPTLTLSKDSVQSTTDYKTLLVESVKKIDNPVLYLSGGLDSEIVARALIDAGKKFIPVAFMWKNNEDLVINQSELNYAIDFCKQNNLNLDIMELNVISLWETTEFFEFAKDIQLQSTQQLTHAYTINLVNEKYPNSTHLFGGEVRFNIQNQEDSIVNVVFLDKVDPPGYNGQLYEAFTGGALASSCSLRYNGDDGLYTIVRIQIGGNTSGVWTTTFSSSYEYRITSVTIDQSYIGGQTIPDSAGPFPTVWTPITGDTLICRSRIVDPFAIIQATFGIEVRVVGETSPVVSSTISLRAEGVA